MQEIQDEFDYYEIIREVSSTLQQPHKFAEVFCIAATSQVKIQETIESIVEKSFDKQKIIDHIRKHQRLVNEEDWKTTLKKSGLFIVSGVTFILGGITMSIINILAKKFGG